MPPANQSTGPTGIQNMQQTEHTGAYQHPMSQTQNTNQRSDGFGAYESAGFQGYQPNLATSGYHAPTNQLTKPTGIQNMQQTEHAGASQAPMNQTQNAYQRPDGFGAGESAGFQEYQPNPATSGHYDPTKQLNNPTGIQNVQQTEHAGASQSAMNQVQNANQTSSGFGAYNSVGFQEYQPNVAENRAP